MKRKHFLYPLLGAALVALASVGGQTFKPAPAQAAEADVVRASEAERIAVINKVKPAVVAVFARGGRGGGSGVLISPEGYALTNFHVVQPAGPLMQCGLPDGILYDAVLVGLDKVGDVALIKLIPKQEGKPFPFAPLGDSDKVKPGDWSLAMGNPFLLATDFTPSVSFGLVSGTNRYQPPEGKGLLEYTDCIQFDTTINPGNSGGPLFNMNGELIGINGRGSFAQDKRFRINCGVGYAISINQIKNFLGHFRAGIDTDHATLGARFKTANEDGELSQIVVDEVLDEADAKRRGLQEGDELVSFAGRPATSVNQYKNILGIFPKEWRVPLVFRHENERKEVLVRLMGHQAEAILQPQPKGGPNPQPQPKAAPLPNSPAAKYYKTRKGFANYYFNELKQNELLAALKKLGDFSDVAGDWTIDGTYEIDGRNGDLRLQVVEEKGDDGTVRTVSKVKTNADYSLAPLKGGLNENDLRDPPNSGGLLEAMYHYKRFLTMGPKGFESNNFTHGGSEPFYPMPLDGTKPKSLKDLRVMAEVIRTEHAGVNGKWYFFKAALNPGRDDLKARYPEGALIGFEIYIAKDADPCEVYLHDYKDVGGRQLPQKMEVRYGDKRYAVFTLKNFQLARAAK